MPSSSLPNDHFANSLGSARKSLKNPNTEFRDLSVDRDPLEALTASLVLIKEYFNQMAAELKVTAAGDYHLNQSGQLIYTQGYLHKDNRLQAFNTISSLWQLLDYKLSDLSPSQNPGGIVKAALADYIEQTPFLKFCSGAFASPGSPEVLDMFTRGNLPACLLPEGQRLERFSLTPFGALLHYFHINTPAAAAHGLRLRVFRSFFKDFAAKNAKPVDYLSFGVGNGCEFEFLKNGSDLFASSTLLGVNQQSLIDTATIIAGIGAPPAHTIMTDAKQLLITGPKLKDSLAAYSNRMDIVSCLGTLDYIPKRAASEALVVESLKAQLACVKPGGFLIASFIMSGNPHKAVLRDLLNWKLNHRSISDLSSIAKDLNLSLHDSDKELISQRVRGISSNLSANLVPGTYQIVAVDPMIVNTFLVIRKALD